MNRKPISLAGAAMALLLLAACGSTGGDILGGGNNNPPIANNTLRGTVESVDTANRSIYLTNVSGYSNMLSNSGGNSVRVYYDNRTAVDYQGQTYSPTDLERGDEVSVRVNESGNSLVAESVSVLRDVSGTSSGSYPNSTLSTIRGTVRYIDTSRRTIEVDRGYGSSVFVEYDTQMPVSFNGRNYAVADLERGDEIDIRVTDLGNSRMRADSISVVRSVSGTNGNNNSGIYGNNNSNMSTVRGTVRNIDTSRRTIELEQANWINGFQSGTGGYGTTVIISYGANAGIEVNGTMQSLSGLERGDVIEVQVDRSGSTNYANRIFLIRDARR